MRRLHRFIQILLGRPRLWTSIALGVLAWLLMPMISGNHLGTRYLLAWNVCALTYLALSTHMLRFSDTDRIRRRALKQNEGRFLVLAMVLMGAISVLVAITSELGPIKDAQSELEKIYRLFMTIVTVVSTWLFIHTIFATHYAHDYYLALSGHKPAPMQFPGEDQQPDYGDFLYAAFIIGTSGQTADVSFTSRPLRRICLLHCTFSFFFNTTILALTINIAASLI